MYQGQPLIEGIFAAARSLGFLLTAYQPIYQVSPFGAPVGLRGSGFPAFFDAVFLRRVEDLEAMARSNDHYYMLTRKLAFIALHYGQIEFCLKALHAGSRVRPSAEILEGLQDRAYFGLLERVRRIYNGTSRLYPPPLGIPEGNRPSHLRGTDPAPRSCIPPEAAPIMDPPESIPDPDGSIDAEVMDEAMLRSESPTPFEQCLAAHGYEVEAKGVSIKRLASIKRAGPIS